MPSSGTRLNDDLPGVACDRYFTVPINRDRPIPGLPPGSARFQPSGLIRPVFARLGCQVGSLMYRVALSQRAAAWDPEEVQHSLRIRIAVCCLRRDMSGSALSNTFRLKTWCGCSVRLMLRPASLLPALSQALDAPLWPAGSLLKAGVCYRAFRRLPGQDFHLLEQCVFQDAPCEQS